MAAKETQRVEGFSLSLRIEFVVGCGYRTGWIWQQGGYPVTKEMDT
jgi:hypothetical protein